MDLSFLHADRKDTDQTQHYPRLIRVFAGGKAQIIAYVTQRLICYITAQRHLPKDRCDLQKLTGA